MRVFLLGLMMVVSPWSMAFELMRARWPQPEVSFEFDIVNTRGAPRSPSGTRWNDAFVEAMQRWNGVSGFTFNDGARRVTDPCRDDRVNGVGFRGDDCGFAFGANTLAITSNLFSRDVYLESDIVFNDNEDWDVFDGPLTGIRVDFTRVAAHELGHTLGLDHENSQPALMAPFISNVIGPTRDDLNGVAALYPAQASTACQAAPLTLNVWSNGRLQAEDCRRIELTFVLSPDQSAVDWYCFDLPVAGRVVIRMIADDQTAVDAFLELLDAERQFVALDDDSGQGFDAMIVADLPAGEYNLLANTALSSLQTGNYRIQVSIGGLDQIAGARLQAGNEVVIDSVEFDGQFYRARLLPFAKPGQPEALFWRLADASPTDVQRPGVLVLPETNDTLFYPVEVNSRLYDARLQWSPDPAFPGEALWRLDDARLR